MAPYQQTQSPPACPALYLYPLNDTFIPKQIALAGGVRVKIGRQTNAKTVPGERNGFFDSKVLSRQHAEVWEDGGKIYIKDVKSSNGTFINGDRLSAESVESEPCELKSEDIVEFGIDIVGEDNKTIIHHKVATRVFVVLTPEDAQAAAREHHAHLQHQQQVFAQQQHQHQQQQINQAQAIARRQQGPLSGNNSQLGGLGGLGQSQARPGSKGLSFDHILNKLQMELQKSRETGAELHTLTSAMSDIHDTMGGGAVPPPPPQHHLIPPVRPPTQPDPEQSAAGNTAAAQAAMSTMQTQLRETQSSLQAHVDKIRALERLVEEHEAIKREVGTMREMLTRARSPLAPQLQIEEGEGDLGQHGGTMLARRRGAEEEYDDDSDAQSVCTVTPDDEEMHEERHAVGRPKTPEPTGHGLMDDEHHQENNGHDHRTAVLHDQNAMLAARLEALTGQLEQAIAVSQGLQTHAARASSTIAALEAKVNALEEEQRASRVLGGQLPHPADNIHVSKSEGSDHDMSQLMKSELMREMERRWDAWRARTEEEREAEKRTLAAALEEVRAVVDGHRRGAERVEAVEARVGVVEGQFAGIEHTNARVDEVHARIQDIDVLVQDVDARVGEVDARMANVEEQAQDAQTQVAEIRREGRTRADAVRAISGTGSSLGLGHPGESGLRSAGDSSSTLDASSGVRKRVRKRSSRGSSGEDTASLASSMTHEGSVSTRATSPSEDECDEDEDNTRRVERTPTKGDVVPASSASATDSKHALVSRASGGAVVGRMGGIKDVVRILLGVWVGVLLTCVVLGCGCACGYGMKPAPVLSAAAVAVLAIGVGAWMMTHRVKD